MGNFHIFTKTLQKHPAGTILNYPFILCNVDMALVHFVLLLHSLPCIELPYIIHQNEPRNGILGDCLQRSSVRDHSVSVILFSGYLQTFFIQFLGSTIFSSKVKLNESYTTSKKRNVP